MKLTELLPDWITEMQMQGKSKTTIKGWASTLRAFFRWLQSDLPDPTTLDFNLPRLRKYRVSLTSRGLRPRTIRGNINALRSFGDWLKSEGHIPENYARKLPIPPPDPSSRRLVSEEEITHLVNALPYLPGKDSTLYAAMIIVLIETGVRRQEFLDLKVGDIDLQKKRLTIQHGKGNKRRTVFLAETTLLPLQAWLRERQKRKPIHDWLWMADRARRVGPSTFSDMLDTVKSVAGLKEHSNILPHALRHAFASRLGENGADLSAIQAVLGHGHLTTTAIYMHTDEKRLQAIADMASANREPLPRPQVVTEPQGRKRINLRRRQ